MMRGRKTLVCGAIGTAFVCLLGVGTMRAQGGAQDAARLTTDKLFRNIQVLKGMPIDTFFDAMGMFAASSRGCAMNYPRASCNWTAISLIWWMVILRHTHLITVVPTRQAASSSTLRRVLN